VKLPNLQQRDVVFAIENPVKPISLIARAYIEECEGIYQVAREASQLLPV
jgi:hypothetical protein